MGTFKYRNRAGGLVKYGGEREIEKERREME